MLHLVQALRLYFSNNLGLLVTIDAPASCAKFFARMGFVEFCFTGQYAGVHILSLATTSMDGKTLRKQLGGGAGARYLTGVESFRKRGIAQFVLHLVPGAGTSSVL